MVFASPNKQADLAKAALSVVETTIKVGLRSEVGRVTWGLPILEGSKNFLIAQPYLK